MELKDLMTQKEVTETLGIHVNTLYIWRLQGKLKSYKVGGYNVFFSRKEVMKLKKELEKERR